MKKKRTPLEEELEMMHKFSDALHKQQQTILKPICETFGYGAVMTVVSELWQEKNEAGAFVVGPCKGMVVSCGCEKPHKCDWCCGTGWLTKHVKVVKDKQHEQK